MKRKKKQTSPDATAPVSAAVLAEAYRDLLSDTEYQALIASLDQPLPPSFRVNPLKTTPDFIPNLIVKYGWQLEPIPFCPTGYRVLNAAPSALSATLEHKLGLYYIQEAASMLPVELFTTFDPADLILDMAASPGGKTTHLVSRSGDHGLILANDSSQGRIQSLRFVLQNWGAVNYAVTRFPAERFGEWCPTVFDKILLDAPCSMQGLRTAESHHVRPVTSRESTQLSRRQRAMLSSAVHALRVGGEVVYSTCTLLPEEDEMVVDAILREFPAVLEVSDVQYRLPHPAPGLPHYQGVSFSDPVQRAVRLWPHRLDTAGFFACHMRKTAPIVSPSKPAPFRPLDQVSYHVFTSREEDAFCNGFIDNFGFDLADNLAAFGRTLVRHYEQVFIFPSMLLERFSGLPVQAAGMLLGEQTPEGFLPSQAWVSRYGAQCTRAVLRLDEVSTPAWLAGENLDLPAALPPQDNSYLVILDATGIPLGRAVRTPSGLKNLLRKRMQ